MFIFEKKAFFYSFVLFFCYFFYGKVALSLEKTDPGIVFLESIKNMTAEYTQEQYENQKVSVSNGTIVIKKPDSVMLTYRSKQMKLKIISINNNIKVFDEDLKQTTYIDNQYNELMQFFTKNLKPKKIKKDNNGNLCMTFKHFGNDFEACLNIDLKRKTLLYINVNFLEVPKDKDKGKKSSSTKIPYLKINFKNVCINCGVNNEVFSIKDRRIFNDAEDLEEF